MLNAFHLKQTEVLHEINSIFVAYDFALSVAISQCESKIYALF